MVYFWPKNTLQRRALLSRNIIESADEVLDLLLMRKLWSCNYPFLHGHLGPGFQLANAINPPAANRGGPPGNRTEERRHGWFQKKGGEPLLTCWEAPQFDHWSFLLL